MDDKNKIRKVIYAEGANPFYTDQAEVPKIILPFHRAKQESTPTAANVEESVVKFLKVVEGEFTILHMLYKHHNPNERT